MGCIALTTVQQHNLHALYGETYTFRSVGSCPTLLLLTLHAIRHTVIMREIESGDESSKVCGIFDSIANSLYLASSFFHYPTKQYSVPLVLGCISGLFASHAWRVIEG